MRLLISKKILLFIISAARARAYNININLHAL